MRRKSSTRQTLKRPCDDTQDICERIRGNVFARQCSQRQVQMLEIGSGPRKVQDKYFQGLRAIPIARSTIAPTNPPWALLYVRTTPCAHESWHRGGVEVVVQHVRNFMGKQHVHDGHHLLTPTWIPSADLGFVSAWPPAPSQQPRPQISRAILLLVRRCCPVPPSKSLAILNPRVSCIIHELLRSGCRHLV